MSVFSIGLRLLFLPRSIEGAGETPRDARPLRIGVIMGFIGVILEGLYFFPSDTITIRNVSDSVEILVNSMAGILLGAILLLALLGFDTIVLGACGVRGFKSALYGSCAPCLAIPLAAIPIHAIFSNQMSMRGYSPIFFILIFIFLAWHVVTLGILISHHFSSTELPAKRIYLILGVLFAAEITTSLIFLTQVPPLFDVTYLQFLEEFF